MSNIKQHRIRFKDGSMEKRITELEELLKGIKGVRKVNVDSGKCEILVEYDLIKVTQKDIEKSIVGMDFLLDNGLWQRFRRGWVHFTEENERDNLASKPTSCCEDPTEKHKVTK